MISDKETIANCLSTIKKLVYHNAQHDRAVRELLNAADDSTRYSDWGGPSINDKEKRTAKAIAAVREFYLEE